MTEHPPITPSPELIEEWIELSRPRKDRSPNPNVLATYAARWGADQELEACIKLLSDLGGDGEMIRRYRRPRPKSLEEQKQAIHDEIHQLLAQISANSAGALAVAEPIRRALEALPDKC